MESASCSASEASDDSFWDEASVSISYLNAMIRKILSTFVTLAAILSCQFQNPVSPEYPCGTQGLDCGNTMCCWRGDLCGSDAAFSRCPKGYCCWEGDEMAKAKAPYKAWQASR